MLHRSLVVQGLLAAVLLAAGSRGLFARNNPDREELVATVNSEPVAENTLAYARGAAAGSDWEQASRYYADLATRYCSVVTPDPSRDYLYRPMWRQIIDDILAWPAESRDVYRRLVDPQARLDYQQAVAASDLPALERLAASRFLSTWGDDAAASLADRLIESGRCALALYYYRLILDVYPDTNLDTSRLRAKAVLAARLARLERYIAEDDARTQQDLRRLLGNDGAARLDRAAAGRPPLDSGSGGTDHTSSSPFSMPALVAWKRDLAAAPVAGNYVLASTPIPSCRYDRGHVVVTFGTSAWSLDPKDGGVLWRADAGGLSGSDFPPSYVFEQAHRPLLDDDTVITPMSRADRVSLSQRSGAAIDLVSLKMSNGARLWTWTAMAEVAGMAQELAVDAAPVRDDRAIFVSLITPLNILGETQTAALDRLTGKLRWQQQLGSHNNFLLMQQFKKHAMPMSSALAVRDGILVSAGAGLISAQSTETGLILWTRQLPQIRGAETARCPLQNTPGSLINGHVVGRLNQVLVDGTTVIGGDATAINLAGCDLFTGKLLWTLPAGDSGQLLALVDDGFLAWGRTLRSCDTTGQTRWRLELQTDEILAGEPLLVGKQVLVPTSARLAVVDVRDGTIQASMAWPPARCGGNLTLIPHGLLVAEPRSLVCYELWDHASRRLAAEAKAAPADPAPLLVLGEAAVRLGRVREGLDSLSQATDRSRKDSEAMRNLFVLYDRLLRDMADDDRNVFGPETLDRLRDVAIAPDLVARQALTEGLFYFDREPGRSVVAFHHALAGPELRDTPIDNSALGHGQAGFLAESSVNRLVERHGPALLASLEVQSAEAGRKALSADDPPAALCEAALAWPSTRAARANLDTALRLLDEAGRRDEEIRLLRRLIAVTPPGAGQLKYRLRLAELAAAAGNADEARQQARRIGESTSVASGDNGALSPDLEKTLARLVATRYRGPTAQPAAPTTPPSPYHAAWTFPLPEKTPPVRVSMADYRTPAARAAQPLFVVSREHVWALGRKDGAAVWDRPVALPAKAEPQIPVILLDQALVLGCGQIVLALDPADGRPLWQTDILRRSDVGRTAASSLLAGLIYGAELPPLGSTLQITSLNVENGLIRAATSGSVHLIDPADGYTVSARGRAGGVASKAVVANGSLAALVFPDQPKTIAVWDIATDRDLLSYNSPMPISLLGSGPEPEQVLLSNPSRQIQLVDLLDGKILWQRTPGPLPDRGTTLATPSIIYVASYDGMLAALDARTGKEKWRTPLGQSPDEAAQAITPLGRDILVQCPRLLLRVTPEGKVAWRFTLPRNEFITDLRPLRSRILIVGRSRQPRGREPERVFAFVETVDPNKGTSDGRTELLEHYNRFTLLPDEGGLFVQDADAARLYIQGPPPEEPAPSSDQKPKPAK